MPANPALIAKLDALPTSRLAEVEDFVDFLRSKDQDRAFRRAALLVSEPAFARVWNDPENDVYDAL